MLEHGYIKKFILHPERCVRDYAAEYFAKGYVGDPETTIFLLDAYEKEPETEEQWGIL